MTAAVTSADSPADLEGLQPCGSIGGGPISLQVCAGGGSASVIGGFGLSELRFGGSASVVATAVVGSADIPEDVRSQLESFLGS